MKQRSLTILIRTISRVRGALCQPPERHKEANKVARAYPYPVHDFLQLEFVKSFLRNNEDGTLSRIEVRKDPVSGIKFNCTFPVPQQKEARA